MTTFGSNYSRNLVLDLKKFSLRNPVITAGEACWVYLAIRKWPSDSIKLQVTILKCEICQPSARPAAFQIFHIMAITVFSNRDSFVAQVVVGHDAKSAGAVFPRDHCASCKASLKCSQK